MKGIHRKLVCWTIVSMLIGAAGAESNDQTPLPLLDSHSQVTVGSLQSIPMPARSTESSDKQQAIP